jgi:hypothetical protein
VGESIGRQLEELAPGTDLCSGDEGQNYRNDQ